MTDDHSDWIKSVNKSGMGGNHVDRYKGQSPCGSQTRDAFDIALQAVPSVSSSREEMDESNSRIQFFILQCVASNIWIYWNTTMEAMDCVRDRKGYLKLRSISAEASVQRI